MTEQEIQKKISDWLNKEGWFVNKLMACTISGTPDLIAHKDGKTMYVEVKKPGGRLSRIQQYRIAQLREEGITVYVTDNLNKFKEELNGR